MIASILLLWILLFLVRIEANSFPRSCNLSNTLSELSCFETLTGNFSVLFGIIWDPLIFLWNLVKYYRSMFWNSYLLNILLSLSLCLLKVLSSATDLFLLRSNSSSWMFRELLDLFQLHWGELLQTFQCALFVNIHFGQD